MNQRSAVSRPGAHRDDDEPAFNVKMESKKLVEERTKDMTCDEIMHKAEAHLQSQPASCHHPWWLILHPDGNTDDSDDDEERATTLLQQLATIASREALLLSFQQEDEEDEDISDDEDMYGDVPQPTSAGTSDAILQMTCFVAAVANGDMVDELTQFLRNMLADVNFGVIGREPYSVPRALVDFKTGELLTDPVRPRNAPRHTFVNSTSKAWFESQLMWPAGHSVAQYDSITKLKKAVATWIAGTNILPKIKSSAKADAISVTLRHLDNEHKWILLPQTPTKTLYSLVNRATQAAYASFTLRNFHSNALVRPADHLLLGHTDLVRGGTVEILHFTRQTRRTYEVNIDISDKKFLMPRDSSVLALHSYIHCNAVELSVFNLWYGLIHSGDGMKQGRIAEVDSLLNRHAGSSDTISFEAEPWRWFSTGTQKNREESKHLSRLHLLKELINVFVNRAASFDTTVSLVLGLVTFSDKASVEQEPTPVFEKFRARLEAVEAKGCL
ncbi:hypothetical protein C8R44DRAFT_327724 [Mycena epipterygia]|nr:hypothetical protein C8R44DRAFT_327724 [Mycena epipterygia]